MTAASTIDDWLGESFASNRDAGGLNGAVGISDDNTAIPEKLFLSPNYPNPFNPAATISFGLSQASQVKVRVFNLQD